MKVKLSIIVISAVVLVVCLFIVKARQQDRESNSKLVLQDVKGSDPTRFLLLINQVRAHERNCATGDSELAEYMKHNLNFKPAPPLQWNQKLAKAAADYARFLAKNRILNSSGKEERMFADKAKLAGYDYQSITANTSTNLYGITATVTEWLDSPGACSHIMAFAFTELGAANDGGYSVVLFGKQE